MGKSTWKKYFGAVVVAGLLITSAGCGGSSPPQQSQGSTQPVAQEQTKPPEQKQEQPQPKKNSPKVSKAEFDQIKSGMTYEQVKEIIGGEGEVISESGNPGDQFHTVMYQYEGEGELGANASFTFQGGKLVNKAQFGLK